MYWGFEGTASSLCFESKTCTRVCEPAVIGEISAVSNGTTLYDESQRYCGQARRVSDTDRRSDRAPPAKMSRSACCRVNPPKHPSQTLRETTRRKPDSAQTAYSHIQYTPKPLAACIPRHPRNPHQINVTHAHKASTTSKKTKSTHIEPQCRLFSPAIPTLRPCQAQTHSSRRTRTRSQLVRRIRRRRRSSTSRCWRRKQRRIKSTCKQIVVAQGGCASARTAATTNISTQRFLLLTCAQQPSIRQPFGQHHEPCQPEALVLQAEADQQAVSPDCDTC